MSANSKKPHLTSLWSVIESMQHSLEDEGLDDEIVDAAVTRRIETMLGRRLFPDVARLLERTLAGALFGRAALAKA